MLRFLIIDDDAEVIDSYRKIFKNQPCQIETSTAPFAAEERIAKEKFDLILTDLNMPGLSGVNLIESIREGVNEDTPVIVVSGCLEEEIESLICSYEDISCLSKPFARQQLLAAVESYVPWGKSAITS